MNSDPETLTLILPPRLIRQGTVSTPRSLLVSFLHCFFTALSGGIFFASHGMGIERRRASELNFRRSRDKLVKRVELQSVAGQNDFKMAYIVFQQNGTVYSMAAELENFMDGLVTLQKAPREAGTLANAKEVMRVWFRASYPFVELFLAAANTSTSV
jgi:hypothetical protein